MNFYVNTTPTQPAARSQVPDWFRDYIFDPDNPQTFDIPGGEFFAGPRAPGIYTFFQGLIRVGNVVLKGYHPLVFHSPWKWIPLAVFLDALLFPGYFVHVHDVIEVWNASPELWAKFQAWANGPPPDAMEANLWFPLKPDPQPAFTFPPPNPLRWDP